MKVTHDEVGKQVSVGLSKALIFTLGANAGGESLLSQRLT